MDLLTDVPSVEQVLLEKAAKRTVPVNGSIELLPLCNMDCDMCYVRLTREEADQCGRIRTAEEWLEAGRQMAEAGTLFLLLTGGEPLLYPDFEEVCRGLKKLGMVLTLNTNGTLIDEKTADFLASVGIRRVNVSLYGGSNETYRKLCHREDGYDRALRGIRLLRERNVDVRINYTVTSANCADADLIAAIGQEWNTPVNTDVYMMPAARERSAGFDFSSRLPAKEAAEVYVRTKRREFGEEGLRRFAAGILEEVRRNEADAADAAAKTASEGRSEEPIPMECMAGRCSFTVNWLGDLQPCVMLKSPAGNVFTDGFSDAWRKVSEGIRAERLPLKCSRCSKRSICRICRAAAIYEPYAADGEAPAYLCEYSEEVLRLLTALAVDESERGETTLAANENERGQQKFPEAKATDNSEGREQRDR